MGCVKETKKVGMLKRARNALKSIEVIDLVKPPATTLDALTTMRNAFDFVNKAALFSSLPYFVFALFRGVLERHWSAWFFTILFHILACIGLEYSPTAVDRESFLQRAKFRIEGAAMWLIFYVLMSILVWVHSTMHVQNVTLSYVNFINVNTGTQMGVMLASLLFFVYGAFDYIESTLVKPKEQ